MKNIINTRPSLNCAKNNFNVLAILDIPQTMLGVGDEEQRERSHVDYQAG